MSAWFTSVVKQFPNTFLINMSFFSGRNQNLWQLSVLMCLWLLVYRFIMISIFNSTFMYHNTYCTFPLCVCVSVCLSEHFSPEPVAREWMNSGTPTMLSSDVTQLCFVCMSHLYLCTYAWASACMWVYVWARVSSCACVMCKYAKLWPSTCFVQCANMYVCKSAFAYFCLCLLYRPAHAVCLLAPACVWHLCIGMCVCMCVLQWRAHSPGLCTPGCQQKWRPSVCYVSLCLSVCRCPWGVHSACCPRRNQSPFLI